MSVASENLENKAHKTVRVAYMGIKGMPSRGAAERAIESLTEMLKQRYDVTIYCSTRYTRAGTWVPGLRLVRIPTLPGKHLHMLSHNVLSALHALFFGSYDLIHLQHIETAFILPLLRLRYPVISTTRGIPYTTDKWNKVVKLAMRWTEKVLMSLSSEVTAVSQPQAKHLQQYYRRKVLHIPNGVEVHPLVDYDRARLTLKKMGCPTQGYLLFVANRIMPIKGAHLFLEAFRKLPQVCPSAVVVGDLSVVSEYATKLRTLPDDRVHFIPPIQHKGELFGIIQNCRLFVFPSLEEGMSMMLLEVTSLGVPLICSDIPQNVAVLGEHGFYFRSGDVDDLTEKLQWALGHPMEMKEIAQRVQGHVRHHFSWDQVAEEYDKVYRRVIGLGPNNPQKKIEAP